jgi:hypothetical protein
MNIFESLRKEASEAGLDWLVIGGHAAIAYGFARTTSDLDLLVRKTDRIQMDAFDFENGISTVP